MLVPQRCLTLPAAGAFLVLVLGGCGGSGASGTTSTIRSGTAPALRRTPNPTSPADAFEAPHCPPGWERTVDHVTRRVVCEASVTFNDAVETK